MDYPSYFFCRFCEYFNWLTGSMICVRCKRNNKLAGGKE